MGWSLVTIAIFAIFSGRIAPCARIGGAAGSVTIGNGRFFGASQQPGRSMNP
jgi:hypothetical protein